MIREMTFATMLLAGLLQAAFAQYAGWTHSGSLYLLTTPEGANLPATALEKDFPVLVRLDKDWFDFSQAKPGGEDIRFSSAGTSLPYQVEEWDASNGTAAIWVRVPVIQGNARQELKMFWGKPDAAGESSGPAVFNAGNGYASVLHLGAELKDEAGSITPVDAGSMPATGMIGAGRHMAAGKGINGGDHIRNYPFRDDPFTSELWLRAETAGAAVFGWGRYATRYNGRTGDGNEVVISFASPPGFGWGSDGPGGARAGCEPRLGRWYHVAATYSNGTSAIYVDGRLEGSHYHKAAMSVTNDIGMTIGGLRNTFQFAGDVDEVRVSRVARSADWLRLEYENQKAQQTLVGPLVQAGAEFSVSSNALALPEGARVTVTGHAGGAQKIYWILRKGERESLAAVDRFAFPLEAGRVTADEAWVLRFKAVYPDGVKTRDIPITVKESIPEPVVTLKAPGRWNGRDTIEVVPVIANLGAMQAKGAGELRYTWSVADGAVIREVQPGKLVLKRAQCTGTILVKLALNNGGADSVATAAIQVREPKRDAWVQRTPAKDEKPVDNQFFARDDKDHGTLYYNGTLEQAADMVFLKVYANGRLFAESQKPAADKSYAFTVNLKPGLIKYRAELGVKAGGAETVLRTVTNLVCGDAYLIDGQSNAEAGGPNNGPNEDPIMPINDWVRSYGSLLNGTTNCGWGNAVRMHIWGRPNCGFHSIGAWGIVLATNLVGKYGVPICIINGAVGGTRIDQHQRNDANPTDPGTIYGRLLARVQGARLTHGVRGILWHQGENNSGAAAPTGDWDYKSYPQYFVDLAAAWKQDYPNVRSYYVFQVWPLPCAMGPKDDELREAQRTLPRLFSNLRVMSTIGAAGPHGGRGSCHFDLEGYALFAQFMSPLVELDNYGLAPRQTVTAPDLQRARFTSAARDEVALEFAQPVVWAEGAKANLYLDDERAPIASASTAGNIVRLKLTGPSAAGTVTYLRGRDWDGKPEGLLFGANGIAALTFRSVPLQEGK